MGAHSIIQLDRTALMLHFHSKDKSSLVFEMLQSNKYFLIFLNQHRNNNIYSKKKFKKKALSHFCMYPNPILFHACSPYYLLLFFCIFGLLYPFTLILLYLYTATDPPCTNSLTMHNSPSSPDHQASSPSR